MTAAAVTAMRIVNAANTFSDDSVGRTATR